MADAADKDTPDRRLAYRVDDLIIDVGTAQVSRHGQPIALPRLSFDLLLALVKAAPNLVSVDELMSTVWADVVVNAETVSQRVKLLRISLEDDPHNPRYIAVSRGRGYRLVPAVTAPETPAATETPRAPEPTRAASSRWPWALGAALVLATLGALWVIPRDRPAAPRTPAAVSLPERSVAVLPFDNISRSPDDAALAFGVVETLLHRLSASKDLTVIARQSSSSPALRGSDAREIGRRLNARYILEGSLQSTHTQLRVTAQLIDATTNAHVWSLQFDRKPEDIFDIQDEIATRVSEAMRISMLTPQSPGNRGTQDFDAYLAHAQGRAHLATQRVADAKLAIGDFERAVQIDPQFARAYAGLAEAKIIVADGEMSRDRRSNMEKAEIEGGKLLERALELDERDAETHLKLALLHWQGDRADKELARALELNPNSAAGYQLLSALRLHRDRLPDAAMQAIDKARLLSPLEVQYDNEKAMIALYAKSDVPMAEQLSLSVLERDPSSSAALWRLGEIYWCCLAEYARGAKYLEQALQVDPDNEFGRRILMKAYLDMGDTAEARAVAASAPHPVDSRLILVLAYQRDWKGAVDRAFAESRLWTWEPIEQDAIILAMRIQARKTREFKAARDYLSEPAGVTWSADGAPTIHEVWFNEYAVGLADILMQSGDRQRGERLLETYLQQVDDEIRTRGRGDRWHLHNNALAYALLNRDDDSLRMLEKSVAEHQTPSLLFHLQNEPAFGQLRANPRFTAVLTQMENLAAAQRKKLDDMRAAGLIVYRSRK